MAEQERRTKAERREEKRRRRMEEEAAAAAAAKRQSLRNGAIAVALVLVLGGLTYLAVGNRTPTIENAITVTSADVEAARTSAGCEVLEVEPIESRDHLDPATAPPEEVLYTNGRPTATGPHYETPGPIYSGVRDEQLDERATTHNLEHGSVIIWFDPEQVSGDDVDEIDELVSSLNEAGFAENSGRAGILASEFTDPGIDSGAAIAIRSWGRGLDCDGWDVDYARGYIAENFGTRGPAPEAAIGQYPEDVLEIVDEDGEASDDASEGGEDTTSDDATDSASDDATDSASDDATDSATEGDEG